MQVAFGRQPLRIQAARLAGVEIPNKKLIEFSLQYVYGIGPVTAKAILSDTVSFTPFPSFPPPSHADCNTERHFGGASSRSSYFIPHETISVRLPEFLNSQLYAP